MHPEPSESEICECLERSGYLLESRLIGALNESGFFVDPNQMLLDPVTGKSREIDIIAEYYDPDRSRGDKCCVKTIYVIEAINNPYPVVLLTERPFSANANFEDYGRCWITGTDEVRSYVDRVESDKLGMREESSLYSQYCCITRKKGGELLASHTEDLYSSLSKAVRYCSDQLKWHEEERGDGFDDDYWRVFYWKPVLVLAGRLLVAGYGSEQQTVVREVDSAKLEFNYHEDGLQRSMLIQVVTERAFLQSLLHDVRIDHEVEKNLCDLRSQVREG